MKRKQGNEYYEFKRLQFEGTESEWDNLVSKYCLKGWNIVVYYGTSCILTRRVKLNERELDALNLIYNIITSDKIIEEVEIRLLTNRLLLSNCTNKDHLLANIMKKYYKELYTTNYQFEINVSDISYLSELKLRLTSDFKDYYDEV